MAINELKGNSLPVNSETFREPGTFTVPAGVTEIYVTGCAAGGGTSNTATRNNNIAGGIAVSPDGKWVWRGGRYNVSTGSSPAIWSSNGEYGRCWRSNTNGSTIGIIDNFGRTLGSYIDSAVANSVVLGTSADYVGFEESTLFTMSATPSSGHIQFLPFGDPGDFSDGGVACIGNFGLGTSQVQVLCPNLTNTQQWNINEIPYNAAILQNELFVGTNQFLHIFQAPAQSSWNTTPLASLSAATLGLTGNMKSMAYGAGLYVIGGDSGTISTASDYNSTWTARTSNLTGTVEEIEYYNGVFIAVDSAGKISRSTDGITWTLVETVVSGQFRPKSILYNPVTNVWLVCDDGEGSFSRISTDNGLTWAAPTTTQTGMPSHHPTSDTSCQNQTVYSNGKFYNSNNTNATNKFQWWESTDGDTWTKVDKDIDGVWNNNDGGDAIIWDSNGNELLRLEGGEGASGNDGGLGGGASKLNPFTPIGNSNPGFGPGGLGEVNTSSTTPRAFARFGYTGGIIQSGSSTTNWGGGGAIPLDLMLDNTRSPGGSGAGGTGSGISGGGGSAFGLGGQAQTSSGILSTGTGYGGGGGSTSTTAFYGAGGAGESCKKLKITVTPGDVLDVSVPKYANWFSYVGTASNPNEGSSGNGGILIIEWVA